MTNVELFKIWGVCNGPWEDQDNNVWLTCKIEEGGAVVKEPQDIPFDTFNEAYDVVRHFHKRIDPIVMSVDVSNWYDA